MNLDKVVCNCRKITKGMIKDAVNNGATTLEEVQKITKAGTACGACIDNVRQLVEQFTSERTNN